VLGGRELTPIWTPFRYQGSGRHGFDARNRLEPLHGLLKRSPPLLDLAHELSDGRL